MTERSLDIILVDTDEVFLKRLAGAMSTGREKKIIVRAFSEAGKALNLLKASQPDALIIGKDSYSEDFKTTFTGKTIVLTEEEGNDDCEMCRYRPAGKILSAIGNPVRRKKEDLVHRDVHTTGIMSFCEAEYKNAYALALASKEAASKKVLYINLDEFSQLRGKLRTAGGYTISDAVYAYRQGIPGSEFIRRSIGRIGGFDYIAPTLCADDLAGLKAREINKFICDISSEYGYNRVILDVGYALGEPWEVFKFCDDADFPYKEGMEGRLSEFGTYMHQSGKTFVLEMIRQIKLPEGLAPYREEDWFESGYLKWLDWLEKGRAAV